MYDTLICRAEVVTHERRFRADVGLRGGRIAAIGHDLPRDAHDIIDADGLALLPGLIDPHVHLNEPGRTEWEGIASGTRALAAGGVTTFIDMPLNSSPPVTHPAAFHAKQALIAQKSLIHGYQWGGLIPGSVDQLEALHEVGVVGFKAFMSDSGVEEFPAADDYTLYCGMGVIARLGSVLAVHAESDALTRGMTQQIRQHSAGMAADYVSTRPPLAELEAIQRALLLAQHTGCALYVVHTSTAEGAALINAARRRGQDATCETCPHYLVLTTDDLERLGAVAKCAPPLRSSTEQAALWQALFNGQIDLIGSDHSPSSPDLKQSGSLFEVWGGISGAQSTLSLLLTFGYHQRGLPLERIVAFTSTYAARRFRLHGKGRIEPGADADLTLADLHAEFTLTADDLHDRHRQNPYLGLRQRGQVVRTLVAGRTVYHEGIFPDG